MSVKYQITLPEDLAFRMREASHSMKIPLAQFIRETMEDSGFYIATVIRNDQHARRAREAVRETASRTTSALVINETVQFLQTRGFLSAALHFLMEAERGALGQIIHVDATLQADGWRLFHKYGGSGASPVDCVSFAIMNRFSIKRAFTFDQHFAAAGFQILK